LHAGEKYLLGKNLFKTINPNPFSKPTTMKTNQKTGKAIAAILCGLVLLTATSKADDEADHDALRKIKAAYEEAVNSNDLSKIEPYLAESVTGVMVTGEEIVGFKGLQSYWEKMKALIGPGGTFKVTVNAEKSDLFGDIAVSRGTTDELVRTGAGKEFKFSSLWTSVCRKQNGEWKVVRVHAAMDPINNVFVKTELQVLKLVYGLAGSVVGIILVLLVCKLRRKRV